ncbi:hypothetical protein BS78_10G189500 [Paspalum vaginatum]|nr:hypothetical protein BS78_10G189500 [Paspalum vaginatum]
MQGRRHGRWGGRSGGRWRRRSGRRRPGSRRSGGQWQRRRRSGRWQPTPRHDAKGDGGPRCGARPRREPRGGKRRQWAWGRRASSPSVVVWWKREVGAGHRWWSILEAQCRGSTHGVGADGGRRWWGEACRRWRQWWRRM